MSTGVLLGQKPRHPENKKLSEALAEDADRFKAQKGLIDKQATLIKATDEGDPDAGTGGTMQPTPEQLAVINSFTRKTVTADEVVAFKTLSCNDIPDRDDDQFTTECVKDFAALPQPYSPTGKSFMLDHAYSVGNAVGRIFSTDTEKVSGALFLTNEVYMPNTAQFQPLIEKIDFGISWAVSVGVMLGKSECSVCGERFSSWGYWCIEGHDKGYYYDPKSEETDSWGYPVPCDPNTKGAIKCIRKFSEPRDMYELSQVFLGAQYFAALDKEPDFAAVMKSVANKELPIIGLSEKEAEVIPFRHEPQKLSEARRAGIKIAEDEDGTLVWMDPQGLRWTFDPENPDEGVMGLGKATNDNDDEDEGDEDDGEHEVPGGEGSEGSDALDGEDASQSDAGSGDGGSGSGSDPGSEGGDESGGEPGSGGSGSSVDDDDDEDADEKGVSNATVLAAVATSKLPESVQSAVKEAKGNALTALLLAASSEIDQLRTANAALTSKAALGEQYVNEVRAAAIDAYIKAHIDKNTKKVSTETFEKVLDRCGDDVSLLKEIRDEQMAEARKKFPSVLRSSMPKDPHDAPKLESFGADDEEVISEGGDDNAARVRRIHG